jgi:hypothetical protein
MSNRLEGRNCRTSLPVSPSVAHAPAEKNQSETWNPSWGNPCYSSQLTARGYSSRHLTPTPIYLLHVPGARLTVITLDLAAMRTEEGSTGAPCGYRVGSHLEVDSGRMCRAEEEQLERQGHLKLIDKRGLRWTGSQDAWECS